MEGSRKADKARSEAAAKSLKQLETALSSTTEAERFYLLTDLAKAAVEAGDVQKAREYATELLDRAARRKNNWHYGNAVHDGNVVLGRVALRSGDLEKAKEHLLTAGRTPGSPQLNSFGPNMTLAKELLQQGEKEAVIEYFRLCANFWEMGSDPLEDWTSAVEAGDIPDFRANLEY